MEIVTGLEEGWGEDGQGMGQGIRPAGLKGPAAGEGNQRRGSVLCPRGCPWGPQAQRSRGLPQGASRGPTELHQRPQAHVGREGGCEFLLEPTDQPPPASLTSDLQALLPAGDTDTMQKGGGLRGPSSCTALDGRGWPSSRGERELPAPSWGKWLGYWGVCHMWGPGADP